MTGLAQSFGVLATDLSEAVEDCAFEVIVERSLESAIVDGRVQLPTTEQFKANVSIQPMAQKDLEMLPQGMMNQGRVKGYSTTELLTVQTSACKRPDRFLHLDVTYQVELVNNYSELGNYFYYEAVRIDR